MRPMRHFTYANVASTLALVLVIGGGGAAVAAGLAKNSVASREIKNGSVHRVDIHQGAVSGAKVGNNTLTGADIRENTLARVPDAAKLGGVPSDGYVLSDNQARVAIGPAGGTEQLTEAYAQYAAVSFTAPTDGYAVVTAQSMFSAASTGTYIDVEVRQDGASANAAPWLWDPGDADGFFDRTQQYFTVVAVTQGTHDFSLWLRESATSTHSTAGYPQVTVQFFGAGDPVPTPPARAAMRQLNRR